MANAELAGRPEDDLLGDPADVDADLSRDVGELGDEVTSRGAVDRVGARPGEAELGRHSLRVEVEARAGQRPGAVRRVRRHPGVPVAQPVDIAQQRPRVGQQVVREQHRLGVLEVGAAGHHGRRVRTEVVVRLRTQHLDQVEHLRRDHGGVVAEEDLEKRGDLVVAAAPGPQPSPDVRADLLHQETLERAVDVLVGRVRHEGARVVPLPQHRVESALSRPPGAGRSWARVGEVVAAASRSGRAQRVTGRGPLRSARPTACQVVRTPGASRSASMRDSASSSRPDGPTSSGSRPSN